MNKFTILDSISGQLEAILKSQVQPEIKGIGNIALYIISGVLLLVLIVRGVFGKTIIRAENSSGVFFSPFSSASLSASRLLHGYGESSGGNSNTLKGW